jgi:glucose-6-phosphate 1-dehydrogenase
MAKLIPVEEFDLVIFGGTGDLAMRKLLPALFHRDQDGQLTDDSRVIAIGRNALDRHDYLARVEVSLHANLGAGEFDEALWEQFRQRIHYVQADASAHDSWGELIATLAPYPARTRVMYLATSPDLFGPIAQGLKRNDLIEPDSRIVLEKPLGHDQASARKINNAVGECFAESQIFRIDHYLGKETVQNLLALRFANSLFEPLWRGDTIDHVQITVAEDLGVGRRIEFYDRIGALHDMVQNHLLQLVCLVAMEAPSNLSYDSVRDEKMKVLRALRPITGENVRMSCVRGQYHAGTIDGDAVDGYLDELDGQDSDTETFVALKLQVDNWRWSDVPFYLRTGKRLKRKHSEIVIQFRDVPHLIFSGQGNDVEPNRLLIRLQPDEGVKLSVMVKEPGPGDYKLRPVSLDLSFGETFGNRYPDAYERLLVEVLRGNPALFMRRDEVESAWQWIDDIIAGWQESRQKIESYVAGSWGPTAASLLLDRDGRAWYPDN